MTHLIRVAVAALVLAVSAPLVAAERQEPLDRAKAFVALLEQEDFAGAVGMFDSTMARAMPEAKLRQFWMSMAAQAGDFQRYASERVDPRGAFQAALLRAVFARMEADITVVLDQDGRVAGFFVKPVR